MPVFEWSGDYGFLGKVMNGAAYTTLSGKTYAEETEPAPFDPAITERTTDYQVKKKSAIWDKKESLST